MSVMACRAEVDRSMAIRVNSSMERSAVPFGAPNGIAPKI
eukprot:CAMPEP_0194376646 /NCGR_PEP_ID=MMETSP0174-20130528/26649_1 /TAXON_ID=216777 /ORGANISM="Proboscia alata, Strain PI-D3" /LENGTH=39 /DNA_ID= /DNA_START= /DNA_END= /DNA_ORIENTATION=